MANCPQLELLNLCINLDLNLQDLKTGTPPRLKKNSINFDILEVQPGDLNPSAIFTFHRYVKISFPSSRFPVILHILIKMCIQFSKRVLRIPQCLRE